MLEFCCLAPTLTKSSEQIRQMTSSHNNLHGSAERISGKFKNLVTSHSNRQLLMVPQQP